MLEPFAPNEIRVAVIGGGTGSFTLLGALKEHTSQIAAIVNMADDGGSTGVLRDELGVLPPGDVRQCLVALSESPKIRELFDYRFEEGTLKGHSFGNIFLTALEKTTGDFAEAVEMASEVLRVNGTVIPATFDNIRLKMTWPSGEELVGQRTVSAEAFPGSPREAKLELEPAPKVNPVAIAAIEQADLVVIAPGDLYASLGPLLVIDGIGKALRDTKAKVIYVCNLVTKDGQTSDMTVSDHAAEIERFAGHEILDAVLYNNQTPSERILQRYEQEKAYLVAVDKDVLEAKRYNAIGGHFLGNIVSYNAAATYLPVTRNLIRHNPHATASAIMDLIQR